jgi:hypothetical protein
LKLQASNDIPCHDCGYGHLNFLAVAKHLKENKQAGMARVWYAIGQGDKVCKHFQNV